MQNIKYYFTVIEITIQVPQLCIIYETNIIIPVKENMLSYLFTELFFTCFGHFDRQDYLLSNKTITEVKSLLIVLEGQRNIRGVGNGPFLRSQSQILVVPGLIGAFQHQYTPIKFFLKNSKNSDSLRPFFYLIFQLIFEKKNYMNFCGEKKI